MADTQLIKDRVDIVELVREYVPLKKSGANWKAPCPFHQEKSPSFMVHPEKQIWHCFGCGKGGDIFSFVQEMEGLEFVEALRLLATRAGVSLQTFRNDLEPSSRHRLLAVLEAAASFYHNFLLTIPAARLARDYLAGRGVSPPSINDWQIGFAPEQWDLLTKYLLPKGFGIDDLVGAGLTIKKDGAEAVSGRGFYDRFRGRIMFPICDPHGTVVGFTGRQLKEDPTAGGKYVNTPETPVFNKSRLLYGLHRAKQEIKRLDQAVIVEGQMDVIACHASGMSNVVAASGTALTLEQVKLLKRYTGTILMAFDADSAGESASLRGIETALSAGLMVRIINLPAGVAKDADECLRKNPAVWNEAVKTAAPFLEWILQLALRRFPTNEPRGKQQAVDFILGPLAHIANVIERDEWLKRVSERLGVELKLLREEFNRRVRLASGRVAMVHSAVAPAALALSEGELLEQDLWTLLVKFPIFFDKLPPALALAFSAPYQELYETLAKLYTRGAQITPEVWRKELPAAGQILFDQLDLRPYRGGDIELPLAAPEVAKLGARLASLLARDRRTTLEQAIRLAEQNGDAVALAELFKQLQSLSIIS